LGYINLVFLHFEILFLMSVNASRNGRTSFAFIASVPY
jgi:hypothetical protein